MNTPPLQGPCLQWPWHQIYSLAPFSMNDIKRIHVVTGMSMTPIDGCGTIVREILGDTLYDSYAKDASSMRDCEIK